MFDELKDQTSKPSVRKATPKIEFPELRCAVHKSPIIIVCMNPDSDKKIFLCSRCVTAESANLKDYEPLKPYDEFVAYINQPSGLKMSPSEEATKLVKSKNSNINGFLEHINQQKYEVSQSINKLNDLYKNKCNELVTSLQDQLESEKDIFSNNYEKFEKEVTADKEKDADMPKFFEIKNQIEKLGDNEKIEEYMRDILRKKQQWGGASVELRTLGKRSEDYYRELIESQISSKPGFSQANPILEYWSQGLDKLITEVKQKANCFENLFKSPTGIELSINRIEELGLLTNSMIKADTELTLTFNNTKVTLSDTEKAAKYIARLSNLRHLSLQFQQSQVTEEVITPFFESVKTLTNLTYFSFSGEGSKNKGVIAQGLAKILSAFTQLQELRLNFNFSDLHDQGASILAEATASLTNLKTLILNLGFNGIKEEGAKAWGTALEGLKNLEDLSINFGGFSGSKNKIKDEGATAIAKSLKFLQKLSNLVLDLGNTQLHNSFTLELSLSLRELNNLQSITLQLYNNGLTEKGGKKIAKAITKLPELKSVNLNLNGNELKKDGVREVINAFRRDKNIEDLTLYLRSVGLQKDDGANFQADLTQGRNYQNLKLYF